MRKIFAVIFFMFLILSQANAQGAVCIASYYNQQPHNFKNGTLGFGITKGFGSFTNNDRGNIGLYFAFWRIESELYFDTGNYDALEQDLGSYYSDYYKTYAGASYTRVSGTRFYSGATGQKIGFIINNYFSAGFAWEICGGFTEIYSEYTYWSTLHDNWINWGCKSDMEKYFGIGVYLKISYPFQLEGTNKLGVFNHYIMPFFSVQVMNSKHNFISIGVAYVIPDFY